MTKPDGGRGAGGWGTCTSGAAGGRVAAPVVAVLVAALVPAGAQAQNAVPGVELGLTYENVYLPPIAVLPFRNAGAGATLAADVQAIIARDLDYSDRFVVIDSLPQGLADQGVQYSLWDQYGADWVLVGHLEEIAGSHYLALELHDIVFTSVERGRFPIPPPGDPGFRMAVHRISDTVVQWVTEEPGIAASRVLFAMNPFGNPSAKEIYIVDFDGEGLRRITWDDNIAISPTWSPDGRRIAYVSYKSGLPRIYELELATGNERAFDFGREGQHLTPAYSPDGGQLAFTILAEGLFAWDLRDDCCLRQLVEGPANNLQPSWSHDGNRVVFVSDRLGVTTPQVYTVPSRGGEASLLSPYRFGQGGYFADPDWSPRTGRVAFAGGIANRRTLARYHIFVADVGTGDRRLIQLTNAGNNEDPSWGPDGRHLVFAGERSDGHGVFVVDSATGRTRRLVAHVRASDTDWSPSLGGGERGGIR